MMNCKIVDNVIDADKSVREGNGVGIDLQSRCATYLSQRRSTFEFRCIRYAAVAEKLIAMGLSQTDIICDVGAGRQDFEVYMRSFHNWKGMYVPIDGSIDGTDLETWVPRHSAGDPDFYVCIEVLEHLRYPGRLMREMYFSARKGVVATTPNSHVIDTLNCDPTHVTALFKSTFETRGWRVEAQPLFCKPNDTLVGWCGKKAA